MHGTVKDSRDCIRDLDGLTAAIERSALPSKDKDALQQRVKKIRRFVAIAEKWLPIEKTVAARLERLKQGRHG